MCNNDNISTLTGIIHDHDYDYDFSNNINQTIDDNIVTSLSINPNFGTLPYDNDEVFFL